MYLVFKIITYPFRFLKRLFEKIYLIGYLSNAKHKGLKLGNESIFNGIPIIKPFQGSKISIGDRFLGNSSKNSNVAGIMMPVTIATMNSNAEIVIGDNVQISGASIVASQSIKIGNNVLIGAGACIWDNDFHPTNAKERSIDPGMNIRSKEILIEDNAFIGARAIILKGVNIGQNAIIGAGAVVHSDVEENSVYSGNPAKFIKKLDQ